MRFSCFCPFLGNPKSVFTLKENFLMLHCYINFVIFIDVEKRREFREGVAAL